MRKFSTFIVKQRLWITIAFALCLIASVVGAFFVEVNYADTVYLPQSSSLKQGLDTMYSEFGEGGNATVMLSKADIEEMMEFKKSVESIDGVSSVIWLDDIFLSEEIGVIKEAIDKFNSEPGEKITDGEAIKFLMHLINRMQFLNAEQMQIIADMNFSDPGAMEILNTLKEGLSSSEQGKFVSFLLYLQSSIPADGSMSFDITMLEDFAPQLAMFYWNDAKRGEYALYQISFVESDYASATMTAIGAIRNLKTPEGSEVRIIGNAATTYNSIQSVNSETGKSMIVAGIIVVIILLLTTTAYWEPVLLLLTIGAAILLNMGTNGIVGYITGVNGISYMTQGVSSVLLLALTMDYSIYLLHRFKQERRGGVSSEEAMVRALTASFSPVSASSLTTIASFVALMFMSYRLGLDMGLVLAKGVVLSIISVFFLMPALILYTEKLIDKTEHKTFNMTFQKFSKGLVKSRFYVPFIILALVIPCVYFQAQNEFTYGPEASLGGEGSALYQDKLDIAEVFGKQNQAIVLMPIKYLDDGAYELNGKRVSTEYMLSMKLMEVDGVSSVQSYSLIDETGFTSMMPDKFLNQFIPDTENPGYSRVVLFLDVDEEGEATTALIDNINGVIAQYTANDAWLLGQSSATLEIKELVNFDYDIITYVSIGLVALILFVTYKSLLIPIILVLVIQGSIYINMAVPYFMRSARIRRIHARQLDTARRDDRLRDTAYVAVYGAPSNDEQVRRRSARACRQLAYADNFRGNTYLRGRFDTVRFESSRDADHRRRRHARRYSVVSHGNGSVAAAAVVARQGDQSDYLEGQTADDRQQNSNRFARDRGAFDRAGERETQEAQALSRNVQQGTRGRHYRQYTQRDRRSRFQSRGRRYVGT